MTGKDQRKQEHRDEDRKDRAGSMTEEGLGGDEQAREKAREERGREHDNARRQMPIER